MPVSSASKKLPNHDPIPGRTRVDGSAGAMAPIDTPDKLKAARKRLGISQRALAEALGLSREAIQTMEYGTRPIERRTDLAIRYLMEAEKA